MNNSIFLEHIKEYTEYEFDKLNNLSDINYKNLWNFIVIKWNYCINSVKQSKYKTLNKILNDSSVPFDWYNDFEFFIKLLTSKLLTKSTFSNPGVNVVFVFL